MTRTMTFVLALGLAVPALAQAPSGGEDGAGNGSAPVDAAPVEKKPIALPDTSKVPSVPEFGVRQIDFGAQSVDSDTNSSRFREYRSLPNGVLLPYVHFKGNQKFWYELSAVNVLQNDARYGFELRPGDFEIKGSYVKIPHLFGNAGRTLLSEEGTGNWVLSNSSALAFQNAIQNQFNLNKPGLNFGFLNNLVQPSLAAATVVDLRLLRDRGNLEVKLKSVSNLDLRVSYFNENRRGTRAAGTSFGFGNVVETPEPIQYRTQDYGLNAEYTRSWGLLRGSFHYNQFDNRVPSELFANPFRATDATDASAYSAPGAGSIGGARLGRVSLPPDNKASTGSLGFVVKFAGRSRFSTDASLGQWTQNDPFIPLTSNSAVQVPNQGLPSSLDGKIKTFSFSSNLTSQPLDHLYLAARFRRYDLDNQTPQIRFPAGYVRFDAVFEAIPRITVPYGYTTDSFVGSASYDFGKLNIEGGYKLDRVDRTFRETEKTTQNVGYARVDVRALDWLVFHGTAEKGSRSFDGLEIERSEDASQLNAGAPANLLAFPSERVCPAGSICNLRYDQAAKDLSRYGAFLELSPGNGKTSFTFSYIKGKDDYKDNLFGLTKVDNQTFSAEVDFTPNDRLNLYGFYSRENLKTSQLGRQSGATLSLNPLDNWTSDIDDKVDSFGGGATLGVVKDKADLKLYGNYQRVDGNNAIASPLGGAPELARRAIGGVAGLPLFDDTKLYTLSAELAYKATQQLTLGLGGWYQYYKLEDSNTVGLVNYVPASFFLAADDSDFKGHLFYVRASYAW